MPLLILPLARNSLILTMSGSLDDSTCFELMSSRRDSSSLLQFFAAWSCEWVRRPWRRDKDLARIYGYKNGNTCRTLLAYLAEINVPICPRLRWNPSMMLRDKVVKARSLSAINQRNQACGTPVGVNVDFQYAHIRSRYSCGGAARDCHFDWDHTHVTNCRSNPHVLRIKGSGHCRKLW